MNYSIFLQWQFVGSKEYELIRVISMKMILFHKHQTVRCTVVGRYYSVAKENTQVPGCQ